MHQVQILLPYICGVSWLNSYIKKPDTVLQLLSYVVDLAPDRRQGAVVRV
jgi:hypothetical protein